MRPSVWWFIPLPLLAAIAALWLRQDQRGSAEPATVMPPSPTASSAASPTIAAATTPAAATSTPTSAATPQPVTDAAQPAFIEGLEPTLRADEAGSLILDSEARNALEMLIGMSAREREQRTQRLQQQLPAVAVSQALDLLPRLSEYRNSVRQLFTDGTAPTTVEQAKAALQTIHQLRLDHLGEEAASRLFGREEGGALMLFESMGRNAPANPTPEDEARLAASVRAAFSLMVLPRQPTRAIGQQDP